MKNQKYCYKKIGKNLNKYGINLGFLENKWYNRQSTLIKGSYKNLLIYNNYSLISSFEKLYNLLKKISHNKLRILFILPYAKHLATKRFLTLLRKSRHDLIFNTINGGFLTNHTSFFKYNPRLQFTIRHSRIHPDFVFFLTPIFHEHIFLEAMLSNIPIIGFVDTSNPNSGVNYPIYSNNKSFIMLKFFTLIIRYFILYEFSLKALPLKYKKRTYNFMSLSKKKCIKNKRNTY